MKANLNYPKFEELLATMAKRIDKLSAQLKKTKHLLLRQNILGQLKATRQAYSELRSAMVTSE